MLIFSIQFNSNFCFFFVRIGKKKATSMYFYCPCLIACGVLDCVERLVSILIIIGGVVVVVAI